MASIGVGAQWGTQMYEQDRLRREENERYFAGRDLFDSQLRTAETNQQVEEYAQAESARVRQALESRKGAIQRGDKQAYVDFLNDVLAAEGRTVVLSGDQVVEVDASGNPIQTIADLTDLTGAQMVAQANQLVPTAREVAQIFTEATEKNIAALQQIQLQQLKGQQALEVANLTGQYGLQAAAIKAAGSGSGSGGADDILKWSLQYGEEFNNQIDNIAAQSINPNWSVSSDPVTGAQRVFDRNTGQPVQLSGDEAEQYINARTELLTLSGSAQGGLYGQPIPYVGAELANRRAYQQLVNTAATRTPQEQAAAASTFTADPTELNARAAQIAQRRNQGISAVQLFPVDLQNSGGIIPFGF